MDAPKCGDRNRQDSTWPHGEAPGCGRTMHAVQYHADVVVDGAGASHLVRPRTCLVCPVCDGPVGGRGSSAPTTLNP